LSTFDRLLELAFVLEEAFDHGNLLLDADGHLGLNLLCVLASIFSYLLDLASVLRLFLGSNFLQELESLLLLISFDLKLKHALSHLHVGLLGFDSRRSWVGSDSRVGANRNREVGRQALFNFSESIRRLGGLVIGRGLEVRELVPKSISGSLLLATRSKNIIQFLPVGSRPLG